MKYKKLIITGILAAALAVSAATVYAVDATTEIVDDGLTEEEYYAGFTHLDPDKVFDPNADSGAEKTSKPAGPDVFDKKPDTTQTEKTAPASGQEYSDKDKEYFESFEHLDPDKVFDPNANPGADKVSRPAGPNVFDHMNQDNSNLSETAVAAGWQQPYNDYRYRYVHEDGSYTTNGWETIDGERYYFDENGFFRSGWIQDNGATYYCNASGHMKTGWVMVDGIYYFMANDGVRCYGWIFVDNDWYYMHPVNGQMQAGWIHTNGNTYFCNASGKMVTGWFKLEDGYHYCNEDKNDGRLIDNAETRRIAAEMI